MQPRFFATPAAFRKWLAANHAKEKELLVGYFKTKTGKPSITWPESVDEALCYGWIDGIRRRIDDESYQIRFTPRRATSHWSNVNVKRVAALTEEGRMKPAGLKAFALRIEARTGRASFENDAALTPDQLRRLQGDKTAWAYFSAQAPSYQKAATWWVCSAKRETTRERRFATLLAASAAGKPVPPLSY